MAMTAAIFLDKDGTLLDDVPYNVDPEKMCFAPGALAGLSNLGRLGLPLIVVSNQAGIAMGRFSVSDVDAMVGQLERMFTLAGARLGGFYYCPHHPQGSVAQYATACECRKPAPGLLQRAAGEHGIDLKASWFVGDILDDIEAGRRAGCNTLLLDNGNETQWRIDEWRTPHRIERNLAEASSWIARWFEARRISVQAAALKGVQA